MGKKERLKRQKQKQDEVLRQDQMEEAALQKSGTKSKQLEKFKKRENPFYLVIKILESIGYAWSAFFVGIITLIAIQQDILKANEEIQSTTDFDKIFILISIGIVLFTVMLVLSWRKKYLLAFGFSAVATWVYIVGANELIRPVKNYLANTAVEESLQNMDKKYMAYYYPAAVLLILALIPAVIKTVQYIKRKRLEKRARDNAPVKSIIN